MSARKKLNTIYFTTATFIALAIGFVTNSFAIFAISLGLLTAGFLHDGSIRPKRRR